MEHFSYDEELKLKELQAKKKRIERAKKKDEDFLAAADERKYELLSRWGISYEGSFGGVGVSPDLNTSGEPIL